MARRSRFGEVPKDLFSIAAAMPWWAGTILAAVAYIVLHAHATTALPTGLDSGDEVQLLVAKLTRLFALYGQYVVPLILLAGAVASAIGRLRRRRLLRDVASSNVLGDMSWQEFELVVGEAFRQRGFSVVETGGGGSDGGIDLRLRKGGELFLVQCKQWRAYKVSVNIIRELLGVMVAEGATGGFVVTSGSFTADARAFARGRNIELIDGRALRAMIHSIQPEVPALISRVHDPGLGTPGIARSSDEPVCPSCGGPMVRRIARQGASAGKRFWGCTSYPRCRGTQAVTGA